MINFRYHVVSLTAIFLALAIGLVLGTAALNGPLSDRLLSEIQSLSNSNSQLRDQVAELEEEVNSQEETIQDLAPLLLDGRLAGQRIALVAMPGAADDELTAVSQMLDMADATIGVQVRFNDRFIDPARNVDLSDLAARLLPERTPPLELPNESDGVQSSAALIAAVLVAQDPPLPAGSGSAVLTGYAEDGMLTYEGDPDTPVDAFLVVAGEPAVDTNGAERNAAVLTTVTQLDQAAVTVVASHGASGEGNVVAAIRSDSSLVDTMSTVDNVNTTLGQVVTVHTLVQELAGITGGHYGNGDGASGPVPQPTDTPTAE